MQYQVSEEELLRSLRQWGKELLFSNTLLSLFLFKYELGTCPKPLMVGVLFAWTPLRCPLRPTYAFWAA